MISEESQELLLTLYIQSKLDLINYTLIQVISYHFFFLNFKFETLAD